MWCWGQFAVLICLKKVPRGIFSDQTISGAFLLCWIEAVPGDMDSEHLGAEGSSGSDQGAGYGAVFQAASLWSVWRSWVFLELIIFLSSASLAVGTISENDLDVHLLFFFFMEVREVHIQNNFINNFKLPLNSPVLIKRVWSKRISQRKLTPALNYWGTWIGFDLNDCKYKLPFWSTFSFYTALSSSPSPL